MVNRWSLATVVILLGVISFNSCKKTDDIQPRKRLPVLPDEPYDYATPPNETFFVPFGDSVIDNDVATLGRVLFYDVSLSRNNRVSCGTCHRQINGFADNRAFSNGLLDSLTGRNTQTIVNTGTQVGFFWDLRESTLDHMVLQPIANHIEMGIADTLYMEDKVRKIDYYPPLFVKAFGSEEVTSKKIGRAIAQFVKSIVSVSTKYDEGRMMQVNPVSNQSNLVDFANYNEMENLGKHLFFRKFACSQCHGGVNLDGSLSAPKNIGLEVDYVDNGMPGVDEFGVKRDGFFKTPSLRNVALTAPYMHNGVFNTLEEVIEFYNSGIQPHPQLSQELRVREQGGLTPEHLGPVIDFNLVPLNQGTLPQKMFMTAQEKAALVAFLKTLTDYEVLTDPKFSDPFK
ncbi:MAG: cytochrome-c peroxidase [Flavobacteriales bacterium]|nr:cytochrome-c peroxidase [Flavobacteriales bacterium]